jgi:hypothetical protein
MQVCLAALVDKVPSEQPDARSLLGMLSLLPNVNTVLQSNAALAACCRGVIRSTAQRYANVRALVTSHQQLQEFKDLPSEVVLAWVKATALVVDSEDSVAVVLDWWIRGRIGRHMKEHFLKELVHQLRVQGMTPGMLGILVHSL